MDWWNALSSVKERGKHHCGLRSNIRAFGDLLSSPLEKTIHLIGASQDFLPKMFFCFYREHVRDITT
jgi:hypothetical protein